MFIHEPFVFVSDDHCEMHGFACRPQCIPQAILLCIHGMMEHSGRYDEFAKYMADHGVIVYAFDLRGHGKTGNDAKTRGFFADKRWKRPAYIGCNRCQEGDFTFP